MTAPQTDPGHLWSDTEWAQIVAEAETQAAAPHRRSLKASATAFPSVTALIRAKYNGGPQPAGGPKFGVLHDAETPLAAGYALSIANMFTRNTNSTSAHFMVGPDATYQLLDTSLIAWHCGNGNTRSIGVEQAGYAANTLAEWTTGPGLQQMGRVAQLMREIHAAHGIGLYWMTDQQLRDAYAGKTAGGWATHAQCSKVLGGSTHTDPTPNYPFAQLMALTNAAPAAPARSGAAVTVLEDDMPTVMQCAGKPPILAVGGLFVELHTPAEVANALWAYNANITGPDGKPVRDPKTGLPGAVWVEPLTLTNLIQQSQQAVRGGTAAA